MLHQYIECLTRHTECWIGVVGTYQTHPGHYVVPLGRFISQCYPPTPEIRAKVKREKPIIKDIRLLDVRSEEMVQDCFDYTDW